MDINRVVWKRAWQNVKIACRAGLHLASQASSFMRGMREAGLILALLGICGVLTLLSPRFLTLTNLTNIAVQSSVTIVTALGMTFVISSGGIDLSTGSVLALSGVLMAKAVKAGLPTIPALLVGLLTGAVTGGINGLIIARVRITPLITTLAMMSGARAIALIVTEARAIYGMPLLLRSLGSGYMGPIPVPAILAACVAIICHILLNYTKLGLAALSIGGNEEAAYLSGINIRKYKILVYVLAGVSYSIGAVITTARLNTAEPIAGYYAEMDAIAAAVIGGASLAGGEATILGSTLGAIIMATLRNGLTLLSVQPYFQQLTIGVVMIAAVFMDKLRRYES